jgi:16S rRNA (guanine527-N7)-methyltransferase
MSAVALLEVAPPPDDRADFAALTGASSGQMGDLEAFRRRLSDWNERMNLVSEASLEDFWRRHAFDSAQLLAAAPGARVWADIGAGAGFPGLVLAIFLKSAPGAKVHLVESREKRCAFLSAVAEELALPAKVHWARAEDLALDVDVVAARAVAPLSRLLGFARPYLARGAVGLFLKGRGAEAEIAEARKAWRFSLEVLPSQSDPSGRILKVSGLAHVR